MTKVKTKNEQGITLVALIITIIILIILAAVSIVHMLNMEIVGQAINSTQDYSAAQYDEKNEMVNIANMIESTIAGVKNNQGGVKDPQDPETPPTPPVELPEVGTAVPAEGWSVEVAKGLVVRDGLAAHTGEIVDYNPPAGGTWRIFYYDNEDQGDGKGYFGDPVGTVYLIRDYDDTTTVDFTNGESYTPSDGGARFYQHNPMWRTSDDGVISLTKERFGSFLCDPSNCEDYLDQSSANYALARPSVSKC